jgi:hypothetical protein
MDSYKAKIIFSDGISTCKGIVTFLREAMCCGTQGRSCDLSDEALDGLGYIYGHLQSQLDEVDNATMSLLELLESKENKQSQGCSKTKVAA